MENKKTFHLTTIDDIGEWFDIACETHNRGLVNYNPDAEDKGMAIRITELNICFIETLCEDAGFSLRFTQRECGNVDNWLEYVDMTVTDNQTGESKTFTFESYLPKPKTYIGKITIPVSAISIEEAKEKIVWEANHMTTDCYFDIKEEG